MSLAFPRGLAVFYGLFLPIGETVRRWHQLNDIHMWPAWLDDILIGAFLLYAAWRLGKDRVSGQRWLASAWGCACGMGYFSFFGQLARIGEVDPGPLSTHSMLMMKGVGLLLAIAALCVSLREPGTRMPAVKANVEPLL